MKTWVNGLNSKFASVKFLKEMVDDVDYSLQSLGIKKSFFLVNIIKSLEQQGPSINEQLSLIDSILNSGQLPEFARTRIRGILEKNTGLTKLREKLTSSADLDYKHRVEYLPLVSVDVERSFSQYKCVLTERRTFLGDDNIEMMNIIMFNRSEEESSSAVPSSSTCTAASTSQQSSSTPPTVYISDEEDTDEEMN